MTGVTVNAPNPEKWKVTEEECRELHETCFEDWNGDNMDHTLMANICERVARRRALEELKALAASICPGCASEPVTACYFGNVISACPSAKVRARIAAIESEAS